MTLIAVSSRNIIISWTKLKKVCIWRDEDSKMRKIGKIQCNTFLYKRLGVWKNCDSLGKLSDNVGCKISELKLYNKLKDI